MSPNSVKNTEVQWPETLVKNSDRKRSNGARWVKDQRESSATAPGCLGIQTLPFFVHSYLEPSRVGSGHTKHRPGRLGQQNTERRVDPGLQNSEPRVGSGNKLPKKSGAARTTNYQTPIPRVESYQGTVSPHTDTGIHTQCNQRGPSLPETPGKHGLWNADCGSTGSNQLRPTSTIHRSPWPCGRKRKASACETRRAISHLGIGGGRTVHALLGLSAADHGSTPWEAIQAGKARKEGRVLLPPPTGVGRGGNRTLTGGACISLR